MGKIIKSKDYEKAPNFLTALQSIIPKIEIEYSDVKIDNKKEFIENYRAKIISLIKDNEQDFSSKALPIAAAWIDKNTNYSLTREVVNEAAKRTAEDAFKQFLKNLETFEIPSEIIDEWQRFKKLDTENFKQELAALEERVLTTILKDKKNTQIATNCVIKTINNSLNNGSPVESWSKDSNNIAYYREKYKNNSYVELTLQDEAGIFLWDEAIKILEKQGAESALLNIYLTGQLFRSGKNILNKITLDAETILKDLGWNRRRRLDKSDQLKKIYDIAFMLGCFRTKYEFHAQLRGNKKSFTFTDDDNAWHIRFKSVGEKSLFSDSTSSLHSEKLLKLWLEITPGAWVEHFLNLQKANNYPQESLYDFGYMCAQITKIDPVHDELALRIALHIAIENTTNYSGLYEVKTLLRTRYSENDLQKAIDGDNSREKMRASEKIRNQWKSALSRLHELGWQIKADRKDYPNWLRPDWLQDENYRPDKKRRKNIINTLLSAKISILQPCPIPEKLEASHAEKRKIQQQTKPLKADYLTPQQIRDARKKLGYTTRKLAGTIGVSPSTISGYENGSKKPSAKTEKSLRQVLKICNKDFNISQKP